MDKKIIHKVTGSYESQDALMDPLIIVPAIGNSQYIDDIRHGKFDCSVIVNTAILFLDSVYC